MPRWPRPSAVARALLFLVVAGLVPPATASTFLVHPDGSGDFPTIQAALDAAADGDSVLLGSGTFTGEGNRELTFRGKELVVRSQAGDPAACVIDCTIDGRAFRFESGEGPGAVVEGIRITGGFAEYQEGGGAILCMGASPTIRGCALDNCTAMWIGGGIAVNGGSPRIERCSFYWTNTAIGTGAAGGAIAVRSGTVEVTSCKIDHCLSVEGAAIWARSADLRIRDTLFHRGFVADRGALEFQDSSVEIARCTVAHNLGGEAQITLENSILVADHLIVAWGDAQAVVCDSFSSAAFTCCDVWGNATGDWIGCLAGQQEGSGNLYVDPILCDTEQEWDPHLRSDSPCAAENNPECGQIGCYGVGCDAPTPTHDASWGKIRSLWR